MSGLLPVFHTYIYEAKVVSDWYKPNSSSLLYVFLCLGFNFLVSERLIHDSVTMGSDSLGSVREMIGWHIHLVYPYWFVRAGITSRTVPAESEPKDERNHSLPLFTITNLVNAFLLSIFLCLRFNFLVRNDKITIGLEFTWCCTELIDWHIHLVYPYWLVSMNQIL